eukprot:1814757-Prymnesium_polylepis.1
MNSTATRAPLSTRQFVFWPGRSPAKAGVHRETHREQQAHSFVCEALHNDGRAAVRVAELHRGVANGAKPDARLLHVAHPVDVLLHLGARLECDRHLVLGPLVWPAAGRAHLPALLCGRHRRGGGLTQYAAIDAQLRTHPPNVNPLHSGFALQYCLA